MHKIMVLLAGLLFMGGAAYGEVRQTEPVDILDRLSEAIERNDIEGFMVELANRTFYQSYCCTRRYARLLSRQEGTTVDYIVTRSDLAMLSFVIVMGLVIGGVMLREGFIEIGVPDILEPSMIVSWGIGILFMAILCKGGIGARAQRVVLARRDLKYRLEAYLKIVLEIWVRMDVRERRKAKQQLENVVHAIKGEQLVSVKTKNDLDAIELLKRVALSLQEFMTYHGSSVRAGVNSRFLTFKPLTDALSSLVASKKHQCKALKDAANFIGVGWKGDPRLLELLNKFATIGLE